jgi:hypothetical protein
MPFDTRVVAVLASSFRSDAQMVQDRACALAGEAMPPFDGHGDMARPVAGGANDKKPAVGAAGLLFPRPSKKASELSPGLGLKSVMIERKI